ncbi:coordinator of PRMT5 and differentiation stimulator isoform X1 [Caretta caretta]|uniref:coordinator of PRMT5 and differentiation stimulator isoform X1 n=1 Tax=Caretta caretta TaxID=8467 RepID=UPI002095A0C9|nr:coordinator of PRMT5 and differentiation stimulator isoform X2 [Caretta caretta]
MEGPGGRQREDDPLEPLLGPEITVPAGDCTCHEEEELVKGGTVVNWRPRKGCLARNVSDGESHQSRFSGCPCYESDTAHSDSSGPPIKWLGDLDDFQSDLEDWELDASFPELKIDSQYEEEDWDKELEDAECNPYVAWSPSGRGSQAGPVSGVRISKKPWIPLTQQSQKADGREGTEETRWQMSIFPASFQLRGPHPNRRELSGRQTWLMP